MTKLPVAWQYVRTLLATLAVVLVAGTATVGLTGTAQAYPEVTFTAEVSKDRVAPGESFTATSTATVECAWQQEWNGTTHTGAGDELTSSFTAPEVDRKTVIPVELRCEYVPSSPGAERTTWTRSIDVTVVPEGRIAPAAAAGAMPDTGGPHVSFLFVGLVLLLSGAVAVRVARGRAARMDRTPAGA